MRLSGMYRTLLPMSGVYLPMSGVTYDGQHFTMMGNTSRWATLHDGQLDDGQHFTMCGQHFTMGNTS
jgi:hypothetical protein